MIRTLTRMACTLMMIGLLSAPALGADISATPGDETLILAKGGHHRGPGDGTGTGDGSRFGDCLLPDAVQSDEGLILARGGNGGGGRGSGNGPGDGTGNGGSGPKDGSGQGKKNGTCINS